MVKPIVKDKFFLSRKSEPATKADAPIIKDLEDTLNANKADCVGMAANMIGEAKDIIIVDLGQSNLVMVNPKIISKTGHYQISEGCLCFEGEQTVTRFRNIEVEYEDRNFKPTHGRFDGWVAEVILHEMDHLQGILI